MNLRVTQTEQITTLILNRPHVHNAFDGPLIAQLIQALHQAIEKSQTRVIVLKATGKHFSAGADLAWMQRMAEASRDENVKDAEQLATLLHTLYHCPKPTLAEVQGAAYGGGAGLVAACDIAIASSDTQFCFSEVKLGLIPAVISPFVIQAIGARAAKAYFMSGASFTAEEALRLGLIHQHVSPGVFEPTALDYAKRLVALPREAVKACKKLVHDVSGQEIDTYLLKKTAQWIADRRSSEEARTCVKAFLKKG